MNELLKKYLEDSGFKLKYVAEQLGLTYPGLKNKLDGRYEFTVSEALKLKQLLSISDEDFKEIFDNETISTSTAVTGEN